MSDYKLFDAEYKFLCIIWENEPINSTLLHKLCLDKLGWKKSTTYTMIRKLTKKLLIKNENTMVTSIVKKHEIKKFESEYVVNKVFENSLPSFIAAFLENKKLTEEEANEIKRMIEEATE